MAKVEQILVLLHENDEAETVAIEIPVETIAAFLGVIRDFANGETHSNNVKRIFREYRDEGLDIDVARLMLNYLLDAYPNLNVHRALQIDSLIQEVYSES